MLRYSALVICLIFCLNNVSGQNPISYCNSPFDISSPVAYCSGLGVFDNVDAQASNDNAFYEIDECWSGISDQNNDVWFRFTAIAKAVNVVINGTANGGSLQEPQVSLYFDNGCFGTINTLACNSSTPNAGVVNLFRGGLIIGQPYFIRVDGRDGGTGSFEICVNNFNPPVEPGQDCGQASVLCDKSSFVVQSVTGSGLDPDEGAGTCISGGFGDSERQSTWFKWTAGSTGSLSFTISPLLLTDDIDWVLYELPNGLDDCSSREVIRCNATFGGDNASCGPLTGLNDTSSELVEDGGCDLGEDGFVRSIDMVEGESYALLVNNWTESGVGFQLDFGGTGEFLGPNSDFIIDANLDQLICDAAVRFIDQSSFTNGSIVSWEWNFGVGADPIFATGSDVQVVTYESFGTKLAALTIESDRGCIVTETFEFNVQACCEVFSDLDLDVAVQDLTCADIPSGSINAQGVLGSPGYQYSSDGINYSLNPLIEDLAIGDYTIFVRDIKGCIAEDTVEITSPPPLIVDAGDDVMQDLGVPTILMGSYSPPEVTAELAWTPDIGINCLDLTCESIEVIAPGTTTYTLTATDQSGCTSADMVTVTTDAVRDVYAPNVFSPDGDFSNDFFKLFSGPSGALIDELVIFDRWGSRVYNGANLPLTDDTTIGWDGKLNGVLVKAGVYAWIAKVRYVDNEVITYSGDITVVR